MKKILEKIKEKKKIIIILFVIIFFVVITLVCYNYFSKNNNISIEVASNTNYIYGPGGESIAKIKTGDIVDLKILAENSKENMVKCYSNNDSLVEFTDKNTFKALNAGEVEVYCKLLNNESNHIKVIIGG